MDNKTPIGSILMFSGKEIPHGWLICDGKKISKTDLKNTFKFAKEGQIERSWKELQNILKNNQLPNLTDRFVMGTERFKKLNETGSPDQHRHNIVSHKPSIKIKEGGAHSHHFPSSWHARKLSGFKEEYTALDTRHDYKGTDTTQSSGVHSHTLDAKSLYFTTEMSTGLNRPKWYALFYIMKVLV